MSDGREIPDDHPIHRIWNYNRKQGRLDGEIELAKEGDPYSARQLLALFHDIVSNTERCLGARREVPKELEDYLAECFESILKGEDPKVALNLSSGKPGRRKLSSVEEQNQADIGYTVACKMEDGDNLEVASEKAAAEHHVSESTAKKAYLKYMKV